MTITRFSVRSSLTLVLEGIAAVLRSTSYCQGNRVFDSYQDDRFHYTVRSLEFPEPFLELSKVNDLLVLLDVMLILPVSHRADFMFATKLSTVF
jgi:hypothetical protein